MIYFKLIGTLKITKYRELTMRKIISGLIILVFAFNVAFITFAHAQNAADTASTGTPSQGLAPAEGEQKNPFDEITKEEIVERLNTLLGYHVDIANNIPGIARTETEDGKVLVTYNGTSLDQLDKEMLITILQQVNRQLNQKNLDNLQRQMKNLRQIDQINKTDRMMRNQRNLKQMQNFNKQQRQLRDLNKKY